MLTNLEIKNFKCFSELKVSPLAKVNLIVGAGNSGKTSLLEAISWLPQKTPGKAFSGPVSFRDSSHKFQHSTEMQRWLCHDLDGGQDFEISGQFLNGGTSHVLQAVVGRHQNHSGLVQVGNLSSKSINWASNYRPVVQVINTDRLAAETLAKSFDRWTLRTEHEGRFVSFLRSVEPRLMSLRPMEPHGMRMMYADIGLPERIPLPMLGEGFNRLVQIIGTIIGEGADIVLADEIDNGLHWKALPQVWTGLKAAVSSSNAQIFATTHSYECIKAAIEVFRGEPRGELAVHRLERRADGQIHCVTIEEEMLEQAVEANWEIR